MISSVMPLDMAVRLRARRFSRMLWLFFTVLLVVGIVGIDSLGGFLAYLLICLAALWPTWLWVRLGEPGIPILPAVALMHLQYYALPILRENYGKYAYRPEDVLTAGLSTSLYLVVITIVWRIVVSRAKGQAPEEPELSLQHGREMVRLGVAGLFFGVLFHVAIFHGMHSSLGSFYGVFRGIAFSLIAVSCFFSGLAWGGGILDNRKKKLCAMLLGLIVVLSWTSLFLVLGVMWIATSVLGYFIASRRIPVFTLLLLVPLVYLLHAGKAEMRDHYWGGNARVGSVLQIPSFYGEWFSSGVGAIAEGRGGQSVFDRASLLGMLLLAQADTPDRYDYLHGRTYAVLPALLVPRFIWPDKPVSQSTLNFLNIRYGLVQQDERGQISTSIGWGVIAEGYVNFGLFGIALIGSAMGLLIGIFSQWSKGKSPVSLPTLGAVAAMVTCINLEADFTYLCVTLFQALIAAVIFYNVFNLLIKRRIRF